MLGLLVLAVLGFVFFKVYGFFINQNIKDQQVVLADQVKVTDAYKLLTGYNKLQAVKLLENQQADILCIFRSDCRREVRYLSKYQVVSM